MQPDLWKITCEEHLYPGLWQRWFRSQSVALGWPPQAGFHLDGSGVRTLGWTIARNALARISRVITRAKKYGEKGRRIHVQWHLELGPDDREQIVQLPSRFRLTGAQLRTTSIGCKKISVAELTRVLADPTNWVQLWANFDYERALSGYIAAYPHRLEDGLLPYPLEKTRERQARGKTRIDVLLIDESGTPVVVECKQGAPALSHLRQLRAYMAQVRKDTGKSPRGILIHGGARKLRGDIRTAAQLRPRIDLVQHNLEVIFSRST